MALTTTERRTGLRHVAAIRLGDVHLAILDRMQKTVDPYTLDYNMLTRTVAIRRCVELAAVQMGWATFDEYGRLQMMDTAQINALEEIRRHERLAAAGVKASAKDRERIKQVVMKARRERK